MQGRRSATSDELVHVATDATTRAVPSLWLVEGFADYVALRDVRCRNGIDPRAGHRGLCAATACRDDMPGLASSTPAQATSRGGYELAWLACRIIAERLGERGLVSVYRAADRGRQVNLVLEDKRKTSQLSLLSRVPGSRALRA